MTYDERLTTLISDHETLLTRPNEVDESWYNGVFARYTNPVLTAAHSPLIWRYDFNCHTNPMLIERLGINAVFNAGAIELNDKFYLACRVEGVDRKSFFAIAESDNGIDNFRFWDYPILFPEDKQNPATNIYDMRLVAHEDGWIYGIFCVERHDPEAPPGDLSSAIAQCGLIRTKDLRTWDRLPDIKTNAAQQRNVVLHPELIDRKYAFYTRPQDSFIDAGTGGGIGWGLSDDITNPQVVNVGIMDPRVYHTIKESKNGMGAPPIKTEKGWLHIAHGVRSTAAGLRYVLYAFLCDLRHPDRVIAAPGGYVLAPQGEERIGDVSNVLFANGIIARKDGSIFLYYASSDTRLHVATSCVDRLLDYVLNTPEDGLRSHRCVKQRYDLIDKNLKVLKELDFDAGQESCW